MQIPNESQTSSTFTLFGKVFRIRPVSLSIYLPCYLKIPVLLLTTAQIFQLMQVATHHLHRQSVTDFINPRKISIINSLVLSFCLASTHTIILQNLILKNYDVEIFSLNRIFNDLLKSGIGIYVSGIKLLVRLQQECLVRVFSMLLGWIEVTYI